MKPMPRRLTIDLRMVRHSGIGRYLRNLLPLLLPQLQADAIRLLVPPGLLDPEPWLTDTRIVQTAVHAPIFSVAEQMLPLRGAFRDTTLLWVPHYNVPLAYRGKLIVTLHDLAPLALAETFTNPLKRLYAGRLLRGAARANAILTVSKFTASELEQRLAVPADCITVTYPGVDREWPTNPAPAAPAVPYLLYVGNVKPNKNLSLLLRAFAQVRDRLPHRLVLAGKKDGFGTGDPAVVRQAASLGDRVQWTGEISDAVLIALYSGASALVLPSLYEGFGLPILEAMQLGCPVFTSSAASLPEVAADAALYFDPRDEHTLARTLLQVLDPTLMEALRHKGFARATHFSYTQCAEDTAPVLNRLLRSPA